MKKYLFAVISLVVMTSFVHAEEKINECMSDIYFANGINTTKPEARRQLKHLIRKQVKKNIFNNDSEKMAKTSNFKLAYNNTMGIAFDLIESYGQKKAEHGTFWWTLGTFFDVYGGIAKHGLKELSSEGLEALIVETLKNTANQFIVGPVIDAAGLKDLASLIKDLRSGVSPKNVWATLMDSVAALENYDTTKQLGNYKNSIKLGHSVIVIAHSQGNLFTNVVYDKISNDKTDKWMTKYFYMIGVASPAGIGTGPKNIEIVTFDNDSITEIPDSIGTPIENPIRYISWYYIRDNNDNGTKPIGCLSREYLKGTVPKSCVGLNDPEYDFWSPYDQDSIAYHLFSYYMKTQISKDKIINFIGKSLALHKNADSQWETDQESNKDTKDYKITVKHKYDPNDVVMNQEVYPFNTAKKLYSVNGEYVKASCGGKNITESDKSWMIDNPEKEKIEEKKKAVAEYLFEHNTKDTVAGKYNLLHWGTGAEAKKFTYNNNGKMGASGVFFDTAHNDSWLAVEGETNWGISSGNASFSFWVKMDNPNQELDSSIFGNGTYPRSARAGFSFQHSYEGFIYDYQDPNLSTGGHARKYFHNTNILPGEWNHVVVIFESIKIYPKVYLNSIQLIDTDIWVEPVYGHPPQRNGMQPYFSRARGNLGVTDRQSDRFVGELDTFRVYDYPLTQTEIDTLFNEAK